MLRSTALSSIALMALLVSSVSTQAAIVITNPANITLANSQVEAGGDTTDNPNVASVPTGLLIPYVASAPGGTCCGAPFGLANLNDGDVGVGNLSDGTYALPNAPGSLTLTFGGTVSVGSIAIYNGYGNRDDGTYTITDAAANLLGGWTISGTGGATNSGVDSFFLKFNSPVSTSALTINFGAIENSASFREIQVFGTVPEPMSLGLLALGGLGFVARRRRLA